MNKPLKSKTMKKIYTLICSIALCLLSMNANAVVINDSLGVGGANTFTPFAINANPGDVIHFICMTGTHSVVNYTGYTNPCSSAPNSGTMNAGDTYDYTVTCSGTYLWMCGIHGTSMYGGAVVSGTAGIVEPATNLLTNFYPNPFKDVATLTFNGVEKVEFFNAIGQNVRTIKLVATETEVAIDFNNLPSGTYFYRTYKEGVVFETKKIVKVQ